MTTLSKVKALKLIYVAQNDVTQEKLFLQINLRLSKSETSTGMQPRESTSWKRKCLKTVKKTCHLT